MSNHLISSVYKRQLGSHMRKSVMALLADKASDDGSGIWASKQTLADELCCSKQTVIATMTQFIADGLLAETGTRKCRTGATVEYAIQVEVLEALPLVACHATKQSKALTGQASQPVKSTPPRGQAAGPKPLEPPKLPKKDKPSLDKRPREIFAAPDGVEDQIWADFLKSPKRRAAGMSETAYGGICRNLLGLAEHGFPPGEMIALAVERGWTTVKLNWVLNDGRQGQTNGMGRHQPAGEARILAAGRAFVSRGVGSAAQ